MTIVDFYDKEQVDDLLEDKADVSSVGTESDVASISGTLWARIKYVLAHWMTKDSEQTVTAKKTFAVSPEVPLTPATDDSAVNSFYVNDSTGTVENNLIHKDGNETIEGVKKIDGMLEHPLKDTKIFGSTPGSGNYRMIYRIARPTTTGGADHNTVEIDILGTALYGKMIVSSDKNNGIKGVIMAYTTGFANISVNGIDAFGIYNSNTDEYEVYIKPNPNLWLQYFVNKVLHKDRPSDISIITEGDNTTTVTNPDQLPGYSGKTAFTVYLNGVLLS